MRQQDVVDEVTCSAITNTRVVLMINNAQRKGVLSEAVISDCLSWSEMYEWAVGTITKNGSYCGDLCSAPKYN